MGGPRRGRRSPVQRDRSRAQAKREWGLLLARPVDVSMMDDAASGDDQDGIRFTF